MQVGEFANCLIEAKNDLQHKYVRLFSGGQVCALAFVFSCFTVFCCASCLVYLVTEIHLSGFELTQLINNACLGTTLDKFITFA